MKKAFVFPGQGSQFVGMGKEMADSFQEAAHVFQEVDDALNQHLSTIIFEGSAEALTLTENTQPALMAVSMAIIRVLEKQGGFKLENEIAYIAGHSLGEYTALAASGAISLADTARLLRIRGNAMQEAVQPGIGAMAALLGCTIDEARVIAKQAAESEICAVANDNAPGQVVLSGHAAAIDRAIKIAAESGKKSVKLSVSAPFHSELMLPAAKIMEKALGQVAIDEPAVPLIANVTASEVSNPEKIKELLVTQVAGMVRWRESILYLKEQGVQNIVEVGAGKVLSGLTKRIDKDIVGTTIQAPHDIELFLKEMS